MACQAASEEAAGVSVTPFMQGLDVPVNRAKTQQNFVGYVCRKGEREPGRSEGKKGKDGGLRRSRRRRRLKVLQVMPLWESFAEMFPPMVRALRAGGAADAGSRRWLISTAS
eukprot:12340-Hanusia_phi.AAC.1